MCAIFAPWKICVLIYPSCLKFLFGKGMHQFYVSKMLATDLRWLSRTRLKIVIELYLAYFQIFRLAKSRNTKITKRTVNQKILVYKVFVIVEHLQNLTEIFSLRLCIFIRFLKPLKVMLNWIQTYHRKKKYFMITLHYTG